MLDQEPDLTWDSGLLQPLNAASHKLSATHSESPPDY